ncbi:MAG: hypothetical protein HKN43_16195 [Rhodothermales bacterium]|nr:hypothetical protein [Rhodothermales bacterium]
MRTFPALAILFSTFLLLSSCDADGGSNTGPAPSASGVTITDTGNESAGSDIEVFYRRPIPETGVSAYRIFVVKESAATAFELSTANGLSADRYMEVPITSSTTVSLSASSRDTDGDLIQDGVAYVAAVLSVADGSGADQNSLSSFSDSQTLTQAVYVGTLTGSISIGSGGMEVDSEGRIYAADFGMTLNGGGTTVRRITPSGEVSTFATGLNGASGNAFDSAGNLMQSNITGGFISRISPSGVPTTFVTSGIAGPVGIAIDDSDNLYIANCGGAGTIQFVTNTGASSVFSSDPLLNGNCPNGIALASDGNLYVALFNNGNVIRVAPDGTASVFANVSGGNNGHITFANGVLYLVDRGGNRIYQITLDGSVTLLAGSGQRGHANGGPTEASFSLPNDLAVSPDGSLIYVNEVSPTTGTNIGPTIIRVIKLPKD